MSVLYSGSQSIGTTEFSLVNASTTIASVATEAVLSVWIDLSAMTAGDQYEIAVREKVTSGGSQMRQVLGAPTGAQDAPFIIPGLHLIYGWDVTVTKLAGTDRTIAWTLRDART